MTALACVRIPNIATLLARRADPAISDQPLVLYSREGGARSSMRRRTTRALRLGWRSIKRCWAALP